MARSVMASNAQNPPIQVVDSDVSTEFPDLSIPVNSIMKANSSDTRVAAHNQTEKVDFPNRTVLSMKETAEVSGTLETLLAQMETNESRSVYSSVSDNFQMDEEKQHNYEEDELEQWNHGYTARCIRIKDTRLHMLVRQNGEMRSGFNNSFVTCKQTYTSVCTSNITIYEILF